MAEAETATETETGQNEAAATANGKDAAVNGKESNGKEPTWPGDWRERLAGEDEKAMARLKRFNAPDDVYKSWRAAEQRLSSEDFIQRLPKDATEDQVKAYREKMGVPEKPEGYLENLSNGLNIGDEDKPILESYLKSVHAKNVPPDVVDATLQWYYNEMDERKAALSEQDNSDKTSGEDELRSLWGDEYRPNLNMMNSFLDTAPEGVKDTILNGRGADGVVLGNNPKVLDWLTRLAKEINPAGIVAPGEAASSKGIDDRLAEIAKYRRENRDKYYKDEKVLAEERRLIDARERMKARA